jgi:mono/diheme cytochrome c family protein
LEGQDLKHFDRRRLGLLLVIGIAFTTFLAFAGTAYSQDVGRGQQVFERNCGFCHGLYGQGKFAVPTIAGAAGHLERFGVPPEAMVPGLTELVREGIPGNMPAFPPEVLSDADIADLASFLLSNPPATGTSLYIASCGFCHGPGGEGLIAAPLLDTPRFIEAMGWTVQQTAQELTELVHEGIPGRMPSFPQFTDLEIERLAVFLIRFDEHTAWRAQFEATHGRAPAIQDYNDRAWSLEFVARTGRAPTDADWADKWQREFGFRQGPPGPPQ